MAAKWIAYNDLAWTEDILANPAEYEDEIKEYLKLIEGVAKKPLQTMLHLGCGAGGHDTHFKKHFSITGVDISRGMLAKAIIANPDIEYHQGDMRTIRLDGKFDIITIPDSIDYMVTIDDLRKAIETFAVHLKSGGILLIVAKTEETFQNNNFVYEGTKDDVQVTLFENNYINPFNPNTYEATLVYMIRQKGELSIHTENQILGLYPLATWEKLFNQFGLRMERFTMGGMYDNNIIGEGEYPLTVFVGLKE